MNYNNSKLGQFLSKYGANKEDPWTHSSMYPNYFSPGKWCIPEDKLSEMYDLLDEYIFKNGGWFNMTEKPEKITNIKIDIDLKFNKDEIMRHNYTEEHIMKIVEIYNRSIKKHLDISDDLLKAYIFERNAPYNDNNGNMKDGIHIIYPYVICETRIQFLIRDRVLYELTPIFSEIGNKNNNINDIIDKNIIESAGWTLYGGSKKSVKQYLLTNIIDIDGNRLNIKQKKTREIIELCSTRNHKNYSKIKDEYLEKLNNESSNLSTKKDYRNDLIAFKVISKISSNEISNIKKLSDMLSSERAESYKTWIEVGLCLHNICRSLIQCWIDFSMKSLKGSKCTTFESLWNGMKTMKQNGLNIGTLHLWAKNDSPDEYEHFMTSSLKEDILNSKSCTTQDVAQVIYKKYKYIYTCVDKSTWYEFKNHRWHLIRDGYTLTKRIGSEILADYNNLIKYYAQNAFEQPEEMRDKFLQNIADLTTVTMKLRDMSFKEKLMKECSLFFRDDQFENKLDENRDLIGFNNGVFDLSTGHFRDGYPEDYITFTTNIDYIEFDENHEYVSQIFEFLDQVFPDEQTRNYVLTVLGTMLEGRNPQEKFYIWSGVGGNGKSKLLELLELSLGRYAAKIDVTYFTRPAGSASSASPETARLKGVRCATTQETEENDKFNISKLKNSSGNDKIVTRHLFGNLFEYTPQYKFIFCCNDKPTLPPDDGGVWRRISVVEFLSRFVDFPDPSKSNEFKRDPRLAEKFTLWKEAFMYILITYYIEYKEKYNSTIIDPPAVKKATDAYQKDNDAYRDFIDSRIIKSEGCILVLDKVYEEFKIWWKSSMDTKVPIPNKNIVRKALENKTRLGTYIRGGWHGLALRSMVTEDEIEEDPIIVEVI